MNGTIITQLFLVNLLSAGGAVCTVYFGQKWVIKIFIFYCGMIEVNF
jgi:hypothetical protein